MFRIKKCLALIMAVLMLSGVFMLQSYAQDKKKLVLIGDSIAAGTGLSDMKDSYGNLVAVANGFDFINLAVPGHTTDNLLWLLNNDSAFTAQLSDADIIGISIGGNNLLYGDTVGIAVDTITNKDYSKVDVIIEDFSKDITEIMGIIRSLNPQATVLLQTLYNPMIIIGVKKVYNYSVTHINQATRDIAQETGMFSVIETGAAFENHAYDYIQSDMVHPNEKGHCAIAQIYTEELYKMGEGSCESLDIAPSDISLPLKDTLFNILRRIVCIINTVIGV